MTQTPIFLSDPHRDIAPHAYVVQVTTTQCQSCGHSGRACETFAKTYLRLAWGRLVTNLRPMKEPPKYKLPIEIIHRTTLTVPFCHECPDPAKIVAHLPYPPSDTPTHQHTGASFIRDDPKKSPASSAGVKPRKTPTTTDDILKDLDL